MDLLTVIIVLLVAGAIVALIKKFGPEYVDGWYVNLICFIILVCVILWLLNVIGFLDYFRRVKVPHV